MSLWKSLGGMVVLATVMVPARTQDVGVNSQPQQQQQPPCFDTNKPYGNAGTLGAARQECQHRAGYRPGETIPAMKCIFETFGGLDDAQQAMSYDVVARAANYFAYENARGKILRGLKACEERAKQSQIPVEEYFHCVADTVVKTCPDFRS